MANVFEPRFDEDSVRYGFRYRRARLGYQAGCRRLGVSLWELPPGQESVYHYHLGNEELAAAIRGRPSLRSPAGWRELVEGEVAAFPRGPRGAHAVANRTPEPIRLLFLSEMRGPEVVIYPDDEGIGALEAMSSPERGGFAAWLRLADAFERHPGESADPASAPASASGRANLLEPAFDEERDRPGFRVRRARLGRQAGAEQLGASLYEVPPGQAPWPYHYHLGEEEVLVVVAGSPRLRTPGGWRTLEAGDVVSFPVGEAGAHQVHNPTSVPVRVLIASQMKAPEVTIDPDSRKVGVFEQASGASATEQLEAWFSLDDAVDYWRGEEPPRADGASSGRAVDAATGDAATGDAG